MSIVATESQVALKQSGDKIVDKIVDKSDLILPDQNTLQIFPAI